MKAREVPPGEPNPRAELLAIALFSLAALCACAFVAFYALDRIPNQTQFLGLSLGGTVTPMPQSVPQRGRLTGAGTPLTPVIVTVALPTKLYVDGDTAKPSLDVNLVLDQPKTVPGFYVYTIGLDKTFNVYVGGNITISAGQAPGLYSNEYVITATNL